MAGEPEPEATMDPWASRTYALQIPPENWSEPRNIGSEIGDFVPTFLLQMGANADGEYEVTMGTATAEGEQNPCNPTSPVTAVSDAYPEVQFGPATFPVHLRHVREPIAVDATIRELTITNVLPDGATLAEEGELTAIMDMRELYPMFTLLGDPTPEQVCLALDSFMAPCSACPHDDEVFCLALKAVELGANESEVELESVTLETRDASCTPPPPADELDGGVE